MKFDHPSIAFKLVDHGSSEWHAAVHLRELVLRSTLGSSFTQEELDAEQHHVHVAGILNNSVVATTALVPEGKQFKMQRVAVSEQFRNNGLGTAMMDFCETYAQSVNVTSIYCHARETAVAFYLGNDYQEDGDYFLEDGIPHVRMTKELETN